MSDGVVSAAFVKQRLRLSALRRSASRVGRALKSLGYVALLGCASMCLAHAQPAVRWELQVIEQGSVVDDFHDITTLGQARTVEATHPSRHAIACPSPGVSAAAAPARPLEFDLTRTITLSPIHLGDDEITFALDTREMVEDSSTNVPHIDCAALPQPRVITLHHPGLAVKNGDWVTLPIVDHDPALSYRIQATLVQP